MSIICVGHTYSFRSILVYYYLLICFNLQLLTLIDYPPMSIFGKYILEVRYVEDSNKSPSIISNLISRDNTTELNSDKYLKIRTPI
jgi:hypothetical protein